MSRDVGRSITTAMKAAVITRASKALRSLTDELMAAAEAAAACSRAAAGLTKALTEGES
jgi:hypothetical protein